MLKDKSPSRHRYDDNSTLPSLTFISAFSSTTTAFFPNMVFHPLLPHKSPLALVVACLATLLLFSKESTASPVPDVFGTVGLLARSLMKRWAGNVAEPQPGSPSTSDYPLDDAILRSFYIVSNPQSPFVFWADVADDRGGAVLASNFAATLTPPGITVVNSFPDGYFCQNGRSEGWWLNFADRISALFATKAGAQSYGTPTYLVTNALPNGPAPDDCATFVRVEAPNLVAARINSVTLVNPQTFAIGKTISLSAYTGSSKREADNSTLLAERSILPGPAGFCPNWEGYGDNAHGGCSSPNLPSLYAPGQYVMPTHLL